MRPYYRDPPTAGLRDLCTPTAAGLPFIIILTRPWFFPLTPLNRARQIQMDVSMQFASKSLH